MGNDHVDWKDTGHRGNARETVMADFPRQRHVWFHLAEMGKERWVRVLVFFCHGFSSYTGTQTMDNSKCCHKSGLVIFLQLPR